MESRNPTIPYEELILKVYQHPFTAVDKFMYLAKTVSCYILIDNEVTSQISKAGTAFGRLRFLCAKSMQNQSFCLAEDVRSYCSILSALWSGDMDYINASQEISIIFMLLVFEEFLTSNGSIKSLTLMSRSKQSQKAF